MENVRTSIMQCIVSNGPITKFACSIIVDISSFIIEFKFVKKVRTVYELLKERDCMGILKHPDIITATTAIIDRSPHTPTLILVVATAPYFYGSILPRALKSKRIVLLTYVYKK
jgi:hypothetical protein